MRTFGLLWLSALALVAIGLAGVNFSQLVPAHLWWHSVWNPDGQDANQMLFHFSLLPRAVLSLLVGAALGLVGVLFQQILRNPLAEPATLGVSAGAQLGLALATLWALPGGETTRQLATIVGAIVAGAIVFGVASGRRMSPITLILAGLVVGLYCGAVKSLLTLFNHERLQSLFLWGSGMLNQYDWSAVSFLWPRMLIGLVIVLLMIRPLAMLSLDDAVIRSLGVNLTVARIAGLGIAMVLSAMLVSVAGVIGFIGLFAPLLARMLGARRLGPQLAVAMLVGALLLVISDQCIILLARYWREVPTGVATALVGAPVMLWLLPHLRHVNVPSVDTVRQSVRERALSTPLLTLYAALLLFLLLVALGSGQDQNGWYWSLHEMWQWRWPRVVAALSAGAMLAVAGALMQKLTGNPMASPEVLGVTSGAAFGVVLLLLLVPGDVSSWRWLAGSAGAGGTLLLIMLLANRGGYSSSRLLLVGIALSTVFSTLLTFILASGDPRTGALLAWLAGSTYKVSPQQAYLSAIIALVLLSATPLLRRWIAIMPLGASVAQSVGVALRPARLLILLLAAGLVATATLVIGPLSFVGLMAPHLARFLGFRRALQQIVIASLLGGMLMLIADWLGRVVIFPYQIPAGLLATFLGAPYFILLLRRQHSA
ncbi:Fe(3+)-hydroxamate ABC transporter permease FhuB [Candidatus Symbiopectobacterium sp. NZEC135]|uniref:Fe(3+)-hydroxamate ABC transporter permease FhuB n=1 Tax=Candidatus Symbiopectobacterium sp. NZEC135 TaxID=2820471 RepID=UPI002227023C|nr:Fe(3+)-hydroxamate ABC transporter permease FhuB [Candidatus Symbiopectobacterium sp. NZEC135]MCW2479883.1 Fe(3+)-hydroxamate ABC transporter permease FhuB [Candidatus Symbiopectobacterium sp. NZEC135]